jgi:hypothetical protein
MLEEQKFQHQLASRHSFDEWHKKSMMEERMLAHCTYINQHAMRMQNEPEARKMLWRFDDNSYFYRSKDEKKQLKVL